MNGTNKNRRINQKPLLLYAALDWGFGHVSRSIPIIKELYNHGWEVVVACNSIQKNILQQEFPQIQTVFLEGYDVKYGKNKLLTWIRISLQAPKILIKIKKERSWMKDFISKNPVKLVISDNRYGFSHSSITSIFITHQLNVITGYGRIVDKIVRYGLYRFIHSFSLCWIPDEKDEKLSLAGKLSHPSHYPSIPVEYIGPLSRLKSPQSFGAKNVLKFTYAFILSGPEPQRTILEKKILHELKNCQKQCIIVRGSFAPTKPFNISSNIQIIDYASSKELENIIDQSEVIVCRPGYTSMMDLLKKQKKCIVIPTPGQTEQEYLSKYLSAKGYCATISQSSFSYALLNVSYDQFNHKNFMGSMNAYKKHISDLTFRLQ